MNAEPRTLSGRCRCGAVEYSVADAFSYAFNCHCANCRRATGAAFKSFAGIEAGKLDVHTGKGNLLLFGGVEAHDARCKTCGSFLYSLVRDSTYVHVTFGTLIDEPTLSPTAHIFVAFKAGWFQITDALPQYLEFPP
jgi:hypothetical protein